MKRYIFNILSVILVAALLVVFIVVFGKVKRRRDAQTGLPVETESPQTDATASPILPEPTDAATEKPDSSGETAENPVFTQAPEGYFKDALFIGDSRTVGLSEYGNLEGASFFATTGMSVYNITGEKVSMPGIGKVTFDVLMTEQTYGKIYIMLGINELGYNQAATVKKYGELIEKIKAYQPQAIIFIEANLHVAQSRSDTDPVFNNRNIDTFNREISGFADWKTVFYIDVNPLFDDENGNLSDKYTADNSHILGKYYKNWKEWLFTVAVVK